MVRFYSNTEVTKQGWAAYYTSQTPIYCNATTNLTAPTGSLSDGSGANDYSNNSRCSWLIKPANAKSITLTFSDFDTELNYDGVIAYDGENSSAAQLGVISGSTIPSPITSTGGSMFIEFISDQALRGKGWDASYTTTLITGLEINTLRDQVKVYPNPASKEVVVQSENTETVNLIITDILGKELAKNVPINKGENRVDLSQFTKGIYLLQFQVGNQRQTQKLQIN